MGYKQNMYVGPPAQVAIVILALSDVVSSRLPKDKINPKSRNAVQGGTNEAYEYEYPEKPNTSHKASHNITHNMAPSQHEMQKMTKEFYEKEIRECHERNDIECLDLPGNCIVDGFSSFKSKCDLLAMIKEESIELSSGWTVKENNHFIGMGVTPTKNKDPNKRQEDVIFIGVRRPNAAKSYHDDKPFFAFLPEVTKNPEYKTLEFMSHLLGGSFQPVTDFADYPGAPMTAKFNLVGIPHLLKFKLDLGNNSSFTLTKDVLSGVPKLKDESNIALLNMTKNYHYVLLGGLHDGQKITEIQVASVSKESFAIRNMNIDIGNEIDAEYYLPNGTLVNEVDPFEINDNRIPIPRSRGPQASPSLKNKTIRKKTIRKKTNRKKKTASSFYGKKHEARN